jgi:hypothetical protein
MEQQLQGLYQQIFNRDLDASGRDFWLSSGKSIKQIADDLNWSKAHGGMQSGGVVGAYASGGVVGNGIFNRDSVRARYAGGGDIMLAGGEHVIRATSNNRETYGTLDFINRNGRVPGNDNSEVVAAIRSLQAAVEAQKAETQALRAAMAQGAVLQIAATEKVAAATNEMATELKVVTSRG